MATQSSNSNRTTTRRNVSKRRVVPQFVSKFTEFLTVKDSAAQMGERQTELRNELAGIISASGQKDDNGHIWLDLPDPIEFEDHPVGTKPGKVHVYTMLKMERHLTPARPTPDPEKAVTLLKKKKLWLTKEQQETLARIQDACPYATITIDVDPDAVAKLYFADRLSDTEYDSVLVEQRETFQFRPSES